MSPISTEHSGITPPSRKSSLNHTAVWGDTKSLNRPYSAAKYLNYGRCTSAVSWKSRGLQRDSFESTMSRDMKVKRWDGAGRSSSAWDGLRKDTELWFPEGNCDIHLYGHGQSKRGSSFRVPFEALVATGCQPLLDRFLVESSVESPASEGSTDSGFFGQPDLAKYDLYIPAPATAEREQAFLYHIATRNFFAWIFGKPLVGTHLGGAIVGLLNSMNEFRTQDYDNVEDILAYLEGEVYADMRNSPDHALGILYFAEHFRFRDMWIDAFAHCCGMNDILITSIGFDYMSSQSRALITRTRMEMDERLDECGRQLSTFLSEELSESFLNLSSPARTHLDNFRTWLQSYYVAKLGYYPPAPPTNTTTAFPSPIFRQMRTEFQKLYNLLVDTTLSATDTLPVSRQGGVCVLQNTRAFDKRLRQNSMPNPFPLLPDNVEEPVVAPKRRFSLAPKAEKVKPDDRVVFEALAQATNRKEEALYDCTLVRAYRGFEKECVMSARTADKSERLSPSEGRKVRWLLIYATLQTLNAATKVPEEVRDVHNVPYNLCVLTKGCPPWNHQRPIETLLRSQTDQAKEDYLQTFSKQMEVEMHDRFEIKPDIDYSMRMHKPAPLQLKGQTSRASLSSRKGSVRRAINSLGSMPELQHPSPRKASFHEILVQGYGNGTLNTVHTPSVAPVVESVEEPKFAQGFSWTEESKRKSSIDSEDSAHGPISSRWSESSFGTRASVTTADLGEFSPFSSNQHSRRPSSSSDYSSYEDDEGFDQPLSDFGLTKVAGVKHNYEDCVYDLSSLSLETLKPKDYDYYMTVTTDVSVSYESSGGQNTTSVADRRMSTINITA